MKSKLKNMNKRVLTVVMSCLMLLGMTPGTMGAFAKGTEKAVDVEITKFEIQNKDHTTANEIYITDTFLLMMKWDASKNQATLHKGDYFDVTLPSNMWFPPNTTAGDFDLADDDGVVLAKAHVTPGPAPNYAGGKVHVVFTDKVENKYNVKGTMYLAARFDKTKVKTDENNNFTVTVNSDVTGITHSSSDGVVIKGPKPLKDEYLSKWGGAVTGIPNQAEWHVRINHEKGILTNVVVTDSLNLPGESFIPESFKLFKVNFNQYGDIGGPGVPVDTSSILKFGENNKSFTLNLGDASNQQYYFEYRTTYTPGTKLINEVKLKSTERTAKWVSVHQSADSGGTAGGDLASKIKLTKVDAENNKPIANAVFTVTRPDKSTFELTTGADGTITSEILPQGVYKVKEKRAPLGYELNEEEYELTVSPSGGALKTISDKPTKVNIEGEKTWDDGNDQDGKRPKSIRVNLLADGKPEKTAEVKPDSEGKWKYRFENLRTHREGKEIKYTVTEDAVAEYTPEIKGYNIKNSYTPKKTSVTVTKRWDDGSNQDGKRPDSIKVQLYADDVKTGDEVELNEGKNWSHTWNDLPEKKTGKLIKYTVKEVGEILGYTTSYDNQNQGNIIICNKHMPEKTKVEGKKTWDDKEDQDGKRPDKITVNLLADGQEIREVAATKDNNWEYSFTELPKYKNGKEIKYTVTEDAVEGYTPGKGEGEFGIKNSYTPEETSVTVTKGWNDGENQDGKRPKSIKVQLYADDKETGGEIELSEEKGWTHTWTGLAKKSKGKDIRYSVKEITKTEGYTTQIDDSNTGNIKIVNSHTPEETEVKGKKTWDDSDNQDGKRPDKITVNLLADGREVREVTATKDKNWEYSFTNLPKYKDGKEIKYTVTEDSVKGYSTDITGYDIRNSYTPKKTSVTVSKNWNDSGDKDGLRPKSIKVQLYANGKKMGDEVQLNEGNKWRYTWKDLAEKEKGKDIEYTVKETGKTAGYTVTVDDKDHGNIIITNTHTPKAVEGAETGDRSNLMLHICIMLLAVAGFVGLMLRKAAVRR